MVNSDSIGATPVIPDNSAQRERRSFLRGNCSAGNSPSAPLELRAPASVSVTPRRFVAASPAAAARRCPQPS